MSWNASNIRQAFLDYFAERQHQIVPSAPMVIKNDPTLMFTNAGMNQFKDLFLGNSEVKWPRVADTQKCLRVSGKHNDLEEVGVDTYHHTMFEMLGNWSFGDYFKEDAIDFAWELLTEVYKIDKSRLYVTVFGGDEADGLDADTEAEGIWQKHIAADRILHCSKKDNFWEMGDTGPCGPCSEIHVDIRSDEERAKLDGKSLVNEDHPQVIEIWNLVFMEFNRMSDGSLKNLPNKHVDTGMGFERLCMVLQGVQSNYDTDVFMPLISKIETLANQKYTASDDKRDVAFRVISDHVRAIAFSIADGQLPSNTGAGYVIRRILRRAVRYGYSFLDRREAFMFELVDVLNQQLGAAFPELAAQKDLITRVIREEEESFLRTLEKGINRFNDYQSHHSSVKGDFAFELYDTFGFPIDLTQLLAAESGMVVDIDGFRAALEEQKNRSRKASEVKTGDWVELREDENEEFVGYDRLETEVVITRYRKVNAKGKDLYQLVFNITPFYAEGGGQVGDQGYIEANNEKVSILDTKKENNLIIHFTKDLPSDVNATFKAVVHSVKRRNTARNHTATHLLHHALREVLGTHVEQKGSLVNADHLRFDFSHFQKVTPEEIRKIEQKVNAAIRANQNLDERRAVPMSEAEEMGAMALFGEKYGDLVRVIKFGHSVELCGGTHVSATGDIGLFKIQSESAVAAGVRRIEAVSGEGAEKEMYKQLDALNEVQNLFKASKNLRKSVEDVLSQNTELTKELDAFKRGQLKALKAELKEAAVLQGDIHTVVKQVDVDAAGMKDMAFQLKAELDRLFLVLVSDVPKPVITIMISDDVAKEKDLNAGALVREWAKAIKGGGGGQAFFATAGGKDAKGLPEVLKIAQEFVTEL